MIKNTIKKIHDYFEKRSFGSIHQLFFAQRLSLLLNSGISISESLKIMSNIENSRTRKGVYGKIIENLEHGMSFGKSLRRNEIKLDNLLVNLINNGESTGRLGESLLLAHGYLEKRSEMKKKLVSSLIYPGFIVVTTIGMTLFLILYIFPKIIPLLSSLNIKLPLITRIVLASYHFLIFYGIYSFLLFFLISIILVFLIKKSQKIKNKFHLLVISIPFFSKYLKIYMISNMCTIGEMMLSSGRSLPDSIIFFRDFYKNLIYKSIFREMYKESVQGINFSSSLNKNKKFFPRLLIDMISLGERTGSLSTMFGHCSKIFEQDMDNFLKKFSSLIEPILMVFMGLIVGSVALSIILPVYEITNHLTK
jgi:type IV pilus assembly protein PilC